MALSVIAALLGAAREIGRREGIRQEQERIAAEAARQVAEATRKATDAAASYHAAGGAQGAAERGIF